MIELAEGAYRSTSRRYGADKSVLPSREDSPTYQRFESPVWVSTGLVGYGDSICELRLYYYWWEPDAKKAAYYCSYRHLVCDYENDKATALKAEEEMTEAFNEIVRAIRAGKDIKKIPEDFGLELMGTDDGYNF